MSYLRIIMMGCFLLISSIIFGQESQDTVQSSSLIALPVVYFGPETSWAFGDLVKLGGNKVMRGFVSGRYLDQNYMAIQMEYRVALYKRMGLVAFLGMGDVFDKFDFDYMRYSYGTGLRVMLNKKEKINMRLDVAWGSGFKSLIII